jgi:lambda family phage portal protein
MAFLDFFRGKREPPRAAQPERSPVATGGTSISANISQSGFGPGFQNGSDGTPRLAWARSQMNGVAWAMGGSVAYNLAFASQANRERAAAASVAHDLAINNPTVATIICALTTSAIGTGLKLSSKPDAIALGIDDAEASALSTEIERGWEAWSTTPRECDLAGRHTLHELAATAYASYLKAGEIVAVPGVVSKTKLSLLDARQLDATKSTNGTDANVLQGVAFHKVTGRVLGYWIRPYINGQTVQQPQPVYVEAYTRWGRPKCVHIFELTNPGQFRGLSPIVAALTPAHEKNSLGEFTLAQALIQSQFALTVESDLPPLAALSGLSVNYAESMKNAVDLRTAWYSEAKVDCAPGIINHLSPGDKLKFNRSETPNSTFDTFDRSLTRSAAKAAGSSYEDVSGDYSQTSFSASRMATELPHRINLRRRKTILEKFYRAVFDAWLEEAISTGRVKVPDNAPPYWMARAAYARADFLGVGRVQADPKKSSENDILEIQNNLCTLRDKLAERGLDLEETIAQIKAERKLLEDAGLTGPGVYAGTVQTRVVENEELHPREDA